MCSGIDLTDLPPLGADPSRTYRPILETAPSTSEERESW